MPTALVMKVDLRQIRRKRTDELNSHVGTARFQDRMVLSVVKTQIPTHNNRVSVSLVFRCNIVTKAFGRIRTGVKPYLKFAKDRFRAELPVDLSLPIRVTYFPRQLNDVLISWPHILEARRIVRKFIRRNTMQEIKRLMIGF